MDEAGRDVLREDYVVVRRFKALDLADPDSMRNQGSVEIYHAVAICTRLTDQVEPWISVFHAVDVDVSCAFVAMTGRTSRTLEPTLQDGMDGVAICEMTQVRR